MSNKLFKKCISLSKDLVIFDKKNPQKHFSYICYRNKIVCTGTNDRWRTTPLANKFNHRFNSRHSEIDAIQRFIYNWSELKNFTMVNVRLNRDLEVMMSKPCQCCQKMLDWFEVGEVFYSVTETQWERFK